MKATKNLIMPPKNVDIEAGVKLFIEAVRDNATLNGFTARDCVKWLNGVFGDLYDTNSVRARLDDMYWNGEAVRGINPDRHSERIYYPAKLGRIG